MKLVLSNKLPLLAFAAVAKTGEAADHRSGVHWARTTRSFNLGVIKSIDDQNNEWEDYFDLALSQWNLSDAFNLVSVSGNSNVGIRNSCPAEEGYIRVCNGNYGSTWWSGYAEYSYYYGQDGHEDHIFQCVVKLNDSKVAWGSEEKKILCHEIGHCLGLDHTSEDGRSDGTCMDYSYGVPQSQGPSSHDFKVLEDIYGHVDSWNSYELVEPPRDDQEPPIQEDELDCSDYDQQDECKDYKSCTWDNGSKGCYDIGSIPEAVEEDETEVVAPSVTSECGSSKKKDCKKLDECFWDKSLEQCAGIPVEQDETEVVAPSVTSECGSSKKKDCKKLDECFWDKSLEQCVAQVSVIPEIPYDVPESQFQDVSFCMIYSNNKDSCKQENDCKWNKGTCIHKNQKRRLAISQNLDCPFDPVDFDVPREAIAIACDGTTITFEKVEGQVATRYHIVLAESFRKRYRTLRGSH